MKISKLRLVLLANSITLSTSLWAQAVQVRATFGWFFLLRTRLSLSKFESNPTE